MSLNDLLEFDKALLLTLNGSENMFLDHVVLVFTSGVTWIPLYISLLYLVIKNNEKWSQILLIISAVGLCMLASNGLNGGFIKPTIARLRPSVEPSLAHLVSLVDGYTAEGYSFFSAHACNSFCVAVFFSLLVRSKLLTSLLFLWASLTAWTRLYLGVHYPFDVAVGMLVGSLIAVLIYIGFMVIYRKMTSKISYVSTQYSSTGYSLSDIDVVVTVFILTCLYCVFRGTLMAGI